MPRTFNTVDTLAAAVSRDVSLQDMIRNDPVKALIQLSARNDDNSEWAYRAAVICLGCVILAAIAGTVYLAAQPADNEISPALIAIGSTAVGALVGMLVPKAASCDDIGR